MKTVFAFDVGLASLGEAVRHGDDIVHADSLLIDPGVADISGQAIRRRQYRSRLTHKDREKWWENIWTSIGKQPLRGIRRENGKWVEGDERLEREFAQTGDSTVYTSCLLRIMLLEGKKLEDWQIYKAVRSAFQRAGYPKVPWARNNDDEKETIERVNAFTEDLQDNFPNVRHRFPCYYDAWKIGLFDPRKGKIVSFCQDHNAERARGYTAPRGLVEKEIMVLLEQAAKQIPQLRAEIAKRISTPDKWREYVLYGPDFSGFNDTKVEGVLDQKLARFDNRCVNMCTAIPRFKVARAENILYFQMHFLLRLANTLVEKDGENKKLTNEEIRERYVVAEEKKKAYMAECIQTKQKPDYEKLAEFYKFTPAQWKKWAAKKGYTVYPATPEVPPPKTGGRTAYSRPAMALIRELILSGKPPHDFREDVVRSNFEKFPAMGLQESDLGFFLRMAENDPQSIYISPGSLAERYAGKHGGELEKGVMEIIGSTRDAKVRHRLTVFFERLKALMEKCGAPDSIIIEFAREDFSSRRSKKAYEDKSKANNKLYTEARSQLREQFGENFADPGNKLVLKYILMRQQGDICPYTGKSISRSQLSYCDIDHIIPQGDKYQGPDAIENKVLTHHETNQQKDDRMPFECDEIITDREAYKNRIEGMQLSGKAKKILLCSRKEEADELIERYYGLAITGWVARLARDIACLWMGWEPGAKGEKRKLHVVSGSLVGKIRREYHLNEALSPVTAAMVPDRTGEERRSENEDEKEKPAAEVKKNREDARHHALDAMVMTYLAEYARDIRKFDNLRLPEGRNHPKYFAQKLEELNVIPHKVARAKAALGETAYRVIERQVIEQKRGKHAMKKERILLRTKGIREIQSAKDARKIIDPQIRKQVEEFFKNNPKPSAEGKEAFYSGLRLKGNGPRILKVKVEAGSPDNTKNLVGFGRGSCYQSGSSSAVGTLQHGVYLYSKGNGKWKVKPVYAFDSPYRVRKKLTEQGYTVKDDVLFYTGCLIEITKPIEGTDVDVGTYTVKTIRADGRIEISKINGEKHGFALSRIGNSFLFVR